MSKKSKSTTEPWKPAQGQLLGAGNALTSAYNQNAGNIQEATNSITSLLPGMIQKYQQGDPAVNAARTYATDVLGGKYLDQGNPYLDAVIGSSNDDMRNQIQAALGAKGLTGGSNYADIISKNILKNSTNLRYGAYNDERNRMGQSVSQAPGLAAADVIQIAPMLATLQAGSAPINAASQYASGLGGLFSPYSSKTAAPSQYEGAKDVIGTALSLASLFSDVRLKENIRRVGQTDGGLPIYVYNYVNDNTPHMGVLAQEVAHMQPEALGPEIEGYMTVRYGALN